MIDYGLVLLRMNHTLSADVMTGALMTKRGLWTNGQDNRLIFLGDYHLRCNRNRHSSGFRVWSRVARDLDSQHTPKQCRERYWEVLYPRRTTRKTTTLSEGEKRLICRRQRLLGNRWAQIAAELPGRSSNQVKNYWHSLQGNKSRKSKWKRKTIVDTKVKHNYAVSESIEHQYSSQTETVLPKEKRLDASPGQQGIYMNTSRANVTDRTDFSQSICLPLLYFSSKEHDQEIIPIANEPTKNPTTHLISVDMPLTHAMKDPVQYPDDHKTNNFVIQSE